MASPTFTFIGYINRDTGQYEYTRIDKIIRVAPCMHEEHKGFAVMVVEAALDVQYIEVDQMVDEFMHDLRKAMEE